MIVTLLCARCARQLGPQVPRPSLARDALRAPAKGMARPVDREAERIRAKKERKASLRKAFRDEGPAGAVRLYLRGRAVIETLASDECPDCQALMAQRRPAA